VRRRVLHQVLLVAATRAAWCPAGPVAWMQRRLQVALSVAQLVVSVPLPAQAALSPQQAVCGPAEFVQHVVVRRAQRWALPVQRSALSLKVASLAAAPDALAVRLLRAESEQAASSALDASEAALRPAELDGTAVLLPVVGAAVVGALLDEVPPAVPLQAEAVGSGVPEALPRAAEAASDEPEVPLRAVALRAVEARHAAAEPQGAVVARRAAAGPREAVVVVRRAAEALPAEAARAEAALPRAEVGRAAPAAVPAAVPSAVAAWAFRPGRLRPAAARRRAARTGHEMRCLQTASRSWRSLQAAQDEVWS
jgi:hypothetical protein